MVEDERFVVVSLLDDVDDDDVLEVIEVPTIEFEDFDVEGRG